MTKTAEQDADAAAKAAQRPRDAATLIVVDNEGPTARILMGKRRTDQVFMPGKFVFPGGRVDVTDKDIPTQDELTSAETSKLLYDMKGHPSPARARGIALAGIREVFEETGIIIGQPASPQSATDVDGWQNFFQRGFLPALSNLCFFARAITPPGRPRRYDTRFFYVPAHHIGLDTGERDEELSEIGWYTIEQSTQLDLPPITRVILEDLSDQLAAGPLGPSRHAVPYYHHRRGTFCRELIDVGAA